MPNPRDIDFGIVKVDGGKDASANGGAASPPGVPRVVGVAGECVGGSAPWLALPLPTAVLWLAPGGGTRGVLAASLLLRYPKP